MNCPIAPARAIETEHPPDGSAVATAFQLNSAHVEGGAYQRAIGLLPEHSIPSRVNLGSSRLPRAVQRQPRSR